MGAIIRPAELISMLDRKSAMMDRAGEECSERRQAVSEFCNDTYLTAEAWDAARSRLSNYSVLYAGITEALERVKSADDTVRGALSSNFGAVAEVNEDEYVRKRDEAQNMLNRIAELECTPYGNDPGFSAGLSLMRYWCDRARIAAQDMLDRIADYLGTTNGIYEGAGSCSDMLATLARGTASLSESEFSKSGVGWPSAADASWIGELKDMLGSNVKSLEDLYSNGELDDGTLEGIFDRPVELWTDGEATAVAQLYRRAGSQAVGGDSTLLERFLNDGYWSCEGIRHIGYSNYQSPNEIYMVRYSMRDGLAGFLSAYAVATTSAAFQANSPLGDTERLLASTAAGLLASGRTYTRTKGFDSYTTAEAALKELGPNLNVSHNRSETVQDGKGEEHTYTYTEVTYGGQVEVPADGGGSLYSHGGFVAMTATTDVNAAFSEMRDIITGRNYKNEYQAAGEGFWGAVSDAVSGKIIDNVPVLGTAKSLVTSTVESYREQSAANHSIDTVFELDRADTEAHYSFYEYGTLVSDASGDGAYVVAPGFESDSEREHFITAYKQYRYDNTNGGTTYDSYLDWARSKPEGGAKLTSSSTWSREEARHATNYRIASNPDDLAWAHPCPSD